MIVFSPIQHLEKKRGGGVYVILMYLLTAIGLTPVAVVQYTFTHKTIQVTTQLTTLVGRLSGIQTQRGQTNWEECGPCPSFVSYIYPGVCLTTEEKAQKNLSQGS